MHAASWAALVGWGLLLLLLLYAALCGLLAHRMTRALRLAPLADPLWHNTHPVTLALQPRGQHLPLAASYFSAPQTGCAVLFVHGKDCCRGAELRISTQPLVRALLDHGISVLRNSRRPNTIAVPIAAPTSVPAPPSTTISSASTDVVSTTVSGLT